MDPYKLMTLYPDCPFSHRQSKLDSYKLGVLFSYIHNDGNLNGAHGSLVDAMAQTDVKICGATTIWTFNSLCRQNDEWCCV
jgi:hypothetical protein